VYWCNIDNHALIEFHDPEDAWHAQMNMNESELFGKVIRVTFAKGLNEEIKSDDSVWGIQKQKEENQ
jgi:RNA recognition motif-containing protein